MSLLQVQLMHTLGPHQRGRTVPSGQLGSKISSRSSEHLIAKLMEMLKATTGGNGGKPTSASKMSGMASSSVALQQQPCLVAVASNDPMAQIHRQKCQGTGRNFLGKMLDLGVYDLAEALEA